MSADISPDDPIYDDIQLLRNEIERCRVILSELDVVQGRRTIADEPPVPVTLLIDEFCIKGLVVIKLSSLLLMTLLTGKFCASLDVLNGCTH